MQIDSATGVISGTPAFGDRGNYALNIRTTDTHGAAVSAPMTVAVTVFNAGQLLVSTSGNDILTGTAGIDTATYAYAPSAVTVSLANPAAQNTGHGSDTLSGIENLIGSAANDTLTGDGQANVLDGGAGGDQLNGGAGNDTYVIDSTSDVINEASTGGTADQVLTWITLPGLANTLTGNAGDNVLDGKSGKDAMLGGAGNDTYMVDNTGDTVTENANEGTDTVQSSVSYTLGNNVENLTLLGTAKINATGNSLANILLGNSGNNTLDGQGGDDSLNGGGGNDILTGGLGIDQLTGGAGADMFSFITLADSGIGASRDVILDFSKLEADKIDVSGIDAKSATSKNDAFTWKGTAAFTAAGELHYFYDGTNNVTIIEGNVDTNLSADFQIQLTGNIALTATDFAL
ncbi:MAG: calcium-binding protein [Betaproteobacteria bacterium]|nr:calcium-binding protein [Betaproteobacteria bacterium]